MFEKIPWHMAHAEADGLRHPMVQRLAHVGTEQNAQDGIHNQKIKITHKNKKQEGLMQLLEGLGLLSLLTPVAGGEVSHVLLPSTLVGMLHRDYPREFRLRFGADIE